MMKMCGSVPPPPPVAGQSKCGFYGDWSNPISRFATTMDTGRIISTSYTILQLDAMAELALAVGEQNDHEEYKTTASTYCIDETIEVTFPLDGVLKFLDSWESF